MVDVCTGAAAGGTLVPSLEALGQILGESANKTIMRLLARTSGQVLSGSGESSFDFNWKNPDFFRSHHVKNKTK